MLPGNKVSRNHAAIAARGGNFVLTDNGSTMGFRYFPAGMKGAKVSLWEGGHRVPLFVRWPAGLPGRPRDEAALTHAQDVLPTVLDLCGVAPPANARFDGRSLGPLLRGQVSGWPDRKLVINYSRMPTNPDSAGAEIVSMPRKEGAAVLWRRCC